MELEGAIKLIGETQTFDSGFTKREFVITTEEQYPQDIKFEVIKDKCEDLDKWKVGSFVKVHMNIRGNEYNGKYYVNLQAWRIEVSEPSGVEMAETTGNEDDLPF